jgi:hypothetical protein
VETDRPVRWLVPALALTHDEAVELGPWSGRTSFGSPTRWPPAFTDSIVSG